MAAPVCPTCGSDYKPLCHCEAEEKAFERENAAQLFIKEHGLQKLGMATYNTARKRYELKGKSHA